MTFTLTPFIDNAVTMSGSFPIRHIGTAHARYSVRIFWSYNANGGCLGVDDINHHNHITTVTGHPYTFSP